MIYSSQTHRVPQPSARYAKTAAMLQEVLGIHVDQYDFSTMDAFRDRLKAIRRDYHDMTKRAQTLLAAEFIALRQLSHVRKLMRAA